MADSPVIQLHHVLQQAVGEKNDVLKALIANGWNIDAPENTLFLSNDAELANATGTVRHAGNHARIDKVQNEILDEFGEQPTQFGKTNLQLMQANPATLPAEQVAAREQVFRDAEAFANNLRDYTAKAIVDQELPLVGIADADIARVFGTVADGYAAFETGTSGGSNSLAAFRAEEQVIKAAGGDIRWQAFNTGDKVETLVDYAKAHDLQLYGGKPTEAGLRDYVVARGLPVPTALEKALGAEVAQGVEKAMASDIAVGGRALGVAGAVLLSAPDAIGTYIAARANGETVLSADGRAAVKALAGLAIGAFFLVPGMAEAAVIGGGILAGYVVLKSVASSAWAYVGEPIEQIKNQLMEGDLTGAMSSVVDVQAAITRWSQEVVAPYVKNIVDDVAAFGNDPTAHVQSLAQQIWNATQGELHNFFAGGSQFLRENADAIMNAVGQGVTNTLAAEAQLATQTLGGSAASISANFASLKSKLDRSNLTGSQPNGSANNSLLTVTGINWSNGAPQQKIPAITDPQPNAPGGYGIISGGGAFTAATVDINIDGIEPVARNYIVTGNVNPAKQTTQSKSSNVAQRLDQGKHASVSGVVNGVRASLSWISNPDKIDPLVLDLNGDGITLSDWVSQTVLFDVIGDGRLHETGWAVGGDGILALDLNGNGVIDNITETISAKFDWGSYNDSLGALASLAQPGAGVFSRATSDINWRTGNSYFDDLRVWVDANEDGVTDAGELKTLDELGITSISLQGTGNQGEAIAGNDVVNRASFTRASGTTGEVASVNFEANSAGATLTQLPGATVVRAEGAQTVTSYIVTDNAGQWIDVSNFTLADGTHPDGFYSTTGNDVFFADPNDTRSYWLGGGTGSLTLLGGAGDDLLFINAATLQANIDGGGGFDIVKVNDTLGVTLDLAAAHVEEAIGDDGNDVFNASGMTSNAFLDGAGGNDILIGGIADDAITGNTGDDFIDGGAGNDVLRGGDGSDLIYGNEGDDIVYGEGGDDILVGGAVSGPNGANMLEGDEGNDLLIGTGGYSVASYRGSFADYTVTQNTDGTFTVADSHADRDGTDTLKDISTLNFADITNVALDSSLPTYGLSLPADDRIDVSSTGPYVISAGVVLANDKNMAGRTLSIRQLLDVNGNPIARGASGAAIGGTVALSTDGATITFTPQAGFTGVMKFKYQVQDSAGQTGLYAQQVGTSSVAEMAGTVFLDTPDHPTDEMFDAQWYLPEINVLPVWKDYTGAGVSIAVFDPSGNVDLTHPDLAANAGNSFKIDGSPGVEQYGMHATLVAGVIGAERNGEGVVGVAYDATISSVAIPTDFVDPDYIDLTRWRNYDVVNNSWTMNPAFVDNFLTNPYYENAYYSAVKYGRGGKGTVLVFAAGNDRGTRNTNDLNETNSLYGITVAGINAKTDLSSLTIGPQPFSTQGETILVSAPGSNIASTSEILTSSTGTVFGSDYATAEGTSFATPIVSGVVALMLEANPNLGYRDVQDILAYSAHKVNDPATSWQINRATNWNGGGLHYSRDYGFGEVDARAAVRLAETWQGQKTTDNLLSRDASNQTGSFGNGSHLVEDYGLFYLWGYFFWLPVGAHVEYSNSFTASYVTPGSDVTAEHVMIYADLDVDLYPIESLKVVYEPLVASGASFDYNGTPYYATNYTYDDSRQSILLDGEQSVSGQSSFYTGADGHRHLNFSFGSTKYRGEDWSSGEQWVLRVFSNGQEVAPSTNWGIRAFGASDAAPRQWIFTDELSSGSWIAPQTSSDSFNASAATGNNVIDLRGGTTDSTINGWNIGVGGDIANGFGGDGNDTLHGNWGDNLLDGGRGDDLLTGDGGSDTFVFQASFGHDTISDFESVDMMRFDQTVFADWSQLLGAAQQVGADTVISAGAANTVTLTNVAVASLNQNQFQFA